jgi:hypothetical protein
MTYIELPCYSKVWNQLLEEFRTWNDNIESKDANDFMDMIDNIVCIVDGNHDNGDHKHRGDSWFDYTNGLTERQYTKMINVIIPSIIKWAILLQYLFPKIYDHRNKRTNKHKLLVLSSQKEKIVTYNESQIASLFANMFLCTFQNKHDTNYTRKPFMPSATFLNLFDGVQEQYKKNARVQKFYFVMNYFDSMLEHLEYFNKYFMDGDSHDSDNDFEDELIERRISFYRKVLGNDEYPRLGFRRDLTRVEFYRKGVIEDTHSDAVHVDFANKFIGGGVLSNGSVQEEIYFLNHPELIVARLFTQKLEENEVMIVKGARQFSLHNGYGYGFKFERSFQDFTKLDEKNRMHKLVIAMNATNYRHNTADQFKLTEIEKELKKAYSGFCKVVKMSAKMGDNYDKPIATGHWGCGAFKGNKELKFVIQWIASSHAKRPMKYFTFGDDTFTKKAKKVYNVCRKYRTRANNLWIILKTFSRNYIFHDNESSLFDHIIEYFEDDLSSEWSSDLSSEWSSDLSSEWSSDLSSEWSS